MSSTTDKIKGAANDAMGKAKEGIGKATDDPNMQAEGLGQQAKGAGAEGHGRREGRGEERGRQGVTAIKLNWFGRPSAGRTLLRTSLIC